MKRLLAPLPIILLALLLVVVLAVPANAGTNRVLFTGEQTVVNDYPSSDDRDFGAGQYAWTGHSFDHMVVLAQDTDLDYLDGTMVQHAAEVMVAPPTGTGWFAVGQGTYTLETSSGDWKGTIAVKVDIFAGITTFSGQGRGVSGVVDGWLVNWTGVFSWGSGLVEISGYVVQK